MTQQFFVGGNFKMYPCSQEEKLALIEVLNEADLDPLTGTQGKLIHWISCTKIGLEVILAPPSLYLILLLETLRKDIKVSAQNCYNKNSGVYTGEIRLVYPVIAQAFSLKYIYYFSPTQLINAKIPYVILGTLASRLYLPYTTRLRLI